jgi:hypothetical protein
MISNEQVKNDNKSSCGICFDNPDCLIKCNRCSFLCCRGCWKKLLTLDNGNDFFENDELVYTNIEFTVKCPQCRKLEHREITNEYVDTIGLNKYDLIDKLSELKILSGRPEDYEDEIIPNTLPRDISISTNSNIEDTDNSVTANTVVASGVDLTTQSAVARFYLSQDPRISDLLRELNEFRISERQLNNTINCLKNQVKILQQPLNNDDAKCKIIREVIKDNLEVREENGKLINQILFTRDNINDNDYVEWLRNEVREENKKIEKEMNIETNNS